MIGEFDNDSLITKTKIKGINIGIVGWTHWINKDVFKDGVGIIKDRDIRLLKWRELKKSSKLDIMVAFPHWDFEFRHFPSRDTVNLAYLLAKNGFDMIVGHHSHVLQPVEIIGGKMISYNLGNLFGHMVTWPSHLSGVLEVNMDKRGKILSYELHPYMLIEKNGKHYLKTIDKLPKELQKKVLSRLELLFDM